MALSIKDGNSTPQLLPNSGIDPMYAASTNGTITTTFTSATDVFQMVGAAGIVARIRRLKIDAITLTTAATVANASVLCRLMRRTAAGTTGTWTALTEAGGTLGRFGGPGATQPAAASVVVNVAGTTAFTVGAGTQMVIQGYATAPVINAATTFSSLPGNSAAGIDWVFGNNGGSPLYLVGATDFLVLNLNAVTPISALVVTAWWDEATL